MRQFDESSQRLQKLFFTFTKEENITSIDEMVCILETLKNKIFHESSLEAQWKEADERIRKSKTGVSEAKWQ